MSAVLSMKTVRYAINWVYSGRAMIRPNRSIMTQSGHREVRILACNVTAKSADWKWSDRKLKPLPAIVKITRVLT